MGGFPFFLLSHTNTIAHRDGKLDRKLICFMMDTISCAAFPSFTLRQNQYLTLLCHIFHFFYVFFSVSYAHRCRDSTGWDFPFSLAQLLSVPHFYPFRLSARTKEKFSRWYRFAWEHNKKKDPKKISPQIFPIIKIFLFLLGGWGGTLRIFIREIGSWAKIWFRGGNPINWLDRTLKNHTLL